ncbi:ATP-binding protein [Marinobacter nauticus]|uniref:ATP-binding protein n=1 Tax=Marinobacter nauticus TaxID=2743 RepID=UPI000EB37A5E|nr:ATP-binding protein [Marinobacter nauticus]MBW3197886.1 sensor histidine kinase N-terminal domain-containing protein [Marinobacter nauticus]MBY6183296.1 sensor histidine kinase N-terminal domain-containing protein [Marinobacter nauticus]RKR72373.1 two-component system sensor histidine kinase QseC [Marinobacter nauticus]
MSLTRTLTLLVTSTVLLIALIASIWSYIESNHELEELFDAELAQSTRIVQGLVRHLVDTQAIEQLPATLSETLTLPLDPAVELDLEADEDEILPGGVGHKYEKKLAFEVWTPEREPLLDTLNSDDNLGLAPGYSWAESRGHRWRTFTLQDPETGFWIRTAQREDIRGELSQELALGNVLPLILALPLLLVAVIVAVQLGFRPLARLEKPIRHMAPERIHPLDDRQAPKEVAGLVQAVNTLLRRLDLALERERRFSADAAHELRTPLAALRLNLERACTEHPELSQDLIQSVDRMVHLVEQMLLLNRVDSGIDFVPTRNNLSAILEQSVADVAPLALKKQIDPVLEDNTHQAMVQCHSALINTLMRSLLANAIQYSPRNTVILTRLVAEGDGYSISVCDQGPGIDAGERERALSRFVRLDQRQGGGAGLGLAIARRIAELHGGHLVLSDRPDGGSGLCVRVWLPTSYRCEQRRR